MQTKQRPVRTRREPTTLTNARTKPPENRPSGARTLYQSQEQGRQSCKYGANYPAADRAVEAEPSVGNHGATCSAANRPVEAEPRVGNGDASYSTANHSVEAEPRVGNGEEPWRWLSWDPFQEIPRPDWREDGDHIGDTLGEPEGDSAWAEELAQATAPSLGTGTKHTL